MSRVGKQIIHVPSGASAEIKDGVLFVSGKGTVLTRKLDNNINVEIEGSQIRVLPKNDELATRALWGTYASHIRNMVEGIKTPYEKRLVVEGVGYRADIQGKDLVLNLGFSHQMRVRIPDELSVSVEKNVITVKGADKELVGQFSAKVRALKKPEPYKGKGIRYSDEEVRRKQGKKSA
jgi:large subunit ribosomal protein L6